MKANKKLKEFKSDENAAIGMIIMGALILVLSIILIPVFYNIAASVNTAGMDVDIRKQMPHPPGKPTNNYNNSTFVSDAVGDVIDIGNSVMSLNPLAALVAVAGGIIGILLSVLSPKVFASAGI